MDLSSPQKVKLLAIMDYLRMETDKNSPVSRQELCTNLNQMGISSNVRTLSLNIETLVDAGYEIMTYMKDHKRYYYVEDRAFSIPELKILIDAVQAATFVTDKKVDELVDKISALGGRHRASILKDNIVHFNTRKHSNEAIYYVDLTVFYDTVIHDIPEMYANAFSFAADPSFNIPRLDLST